MGWGDSKRDLVVAENAGMKREIELLRDQIADLKENRSELIKQLKATQEALIAKESPDAYQEILAARAADKQITPEEIKERELQKKQIAIANAYINSMEDPLFKDKDDMESMLSRAVGIPELKSVHENGES